MNLVSPTPVGRFPAYQPSLVRTHLGNLCSPQDFLSHIGSWVLMMSSGHDGLHSLHHKGRSGKLLLSGLGSLTGDLSRLPTTTKTWLVSGACKKALERILSLPEGVNEAARFWRVYLETSTTSRPSACHRNEHICCS
jgi:hypothetical protein